MANQPPFLPWFRLARPPAPTVPAPAPAVAPAPQAPIQPTALLPRLPFRPAFPQVVRPAAQPQPAGEVAPPPATTRPAAASPKFYQPEAINVPASRTPESPVNASSSIPNGLPTSITSKSPVITTSPATKTLPSSKTSTSPRPPEEGSQLAKTPPAAFISTLATSSSSKPVAAISTITTATTMTIPTIAHLPAPTASPRLVKPIKQTPQFQKTKPMVAPPSPVTLPPSLLMSAGEPKQQVRVEAENETIPVKEMVEKPNNSLKTPSGGTKAILDNSQNAGIAPKGNHGKHKGKKFGMRIISIAGENKGALMELGHSPRGNGIHESNPHGHFLRSQDNVRGGGDGSEIDLSGREGGLKMKEGKHKVMATPSLPIYVNSNVQEVNSSIIYNSLCTQHDPGVHLSLSGKPFNWNGIHRADNVNNDKKIY
ncbi:hypothetical protein Ancab_038034 [Ancistrocladus abbreviatus]